MIRLSLCSAEDILISRLSVISLIGFFLYPPVPAQKGSVRRPSAPSCRIESGPSRFGIRCRNQTEKKQTHVECRSETPNGYGCVKNHCLTSRFPRSNWNMQRHSPVFCAAKAGQSHAHYTTIGLKRSDRTIYSRVHQAVRHDST